MPGRLLSYSAPAPAPAGATRFSEGNAVLRLPPNLTYDGSASEFFAPSDW